MKNAKELVPLAASAALALSGMVTGCKSFEGSYSEKKSSPTGTIERSGHIHIEMNPPTGKKDSAGNILSVTEGGIAFQEQSEWSSGCGYFGENDDIDDEYDEESSQEDFSEDDVIWTC